MSAATDRFIAEFGADILKRYELKFAGLASQALEGIANDDGIEVKLVALVNNDGEGKYEDHQVVLELPVVFYTTCESSRDAGIRISDLLGITTDEAEERLKKIGL